jgi:hypothetical protein
MHWFLTQENFSRFCVKEDACPSVRVTCKLYRSPRPHVEKMAASTPATVEVIVQPPAPDANAEVDIDVSRLKLPHHASLDH